MEQLINVKQGILNAESNYRDLSPIELQKKSNNGENWHERLNEKKGGRFAADVEKTKKQKLEVNTEDLNKLWLIFRDWATEKKNQFIEALQPLCKTELKLQISQSSFKFEYDKNGNPIKILEARIIREEAESNNFFDMLKQSKKEYKIFLECSIHICSNKRAKSFGEIKQFMKKKGLDNKDFDLQPYSNSIRVLYSPKEDGKWPLVPFPDFSTDIKDHLWTYWNEEEELIEFEEEAETSAALKVEKAIIIENSQEFDNSEINYEELSELLFTLPEDYYVDHDKWKNIGLSLCTIKSDEMIGLWKEFSYQMKTKPFSEERKKQDSRIKSIIEDADPNANNIGHFFNICKEALGINKYNEIRSKYRKNKEIENIKQMIYSKDDFYYYEFTNKYHLNTIVNNYEEFIKDMAKVMAFIEIPGKSLIICKQKDEYHKVALSNITSELKRYKIKIDKNLFCGNEQKNKESESYVIIPLLDIFEKHMMRLKREKVIFRPNDINERYFNFWEGPLAKLVLDNEYNENKIQMEINHFYEVLGNNEKEYGDYILNCFAHIAQKPEKPLDIAMVFTSEQGAGKGVIAEFLIDRVFGPKISQLLDNQDHAIGQFNGALEGKILTILDEVVNYDPKKYHCAFDRWKSAITNRKLPINNKHEKLYNIENYNNFIFFSNNDLPVKVEKTDRRFAVFRLNGKYISNFDYFDKLTESMKKNGDMFYTYLMKRDISKFNPKKIPITGLRVIMMDMSRDSLDKFIEDELEMIDENKKYKYEGFYSNENLYQLYKDYCFKNGLDWMKGNTFSGKMKIKYSEARKNNARGINIVRK